MAPEIRVSISHNPVRGTTLANSSLFPSETSEVSSQTATSGREVIRLTQLVRLLLRCTQMIERMPGGLHFKMTTAVSL